MCSLNSCYTKFKLYSCYILHDISRGSVQPTYHAQMPAVSAPKNLSQFWTIFEPQAFEKYVFVCVNFAIVFVFQQKMHRNRGRSFKTSGTARECEDFDSLKFCRSLFSSALRLRNRRGNFMEMLSSGNLRKPRQETSATCRQKCDFSDIQLCNSFLFLNIQIFEKNWYYCVCVCLIKVGQSTQYDIMCVVLSLFFKYAIIQNW